MGMRVSDLVQFLFDGMYRLDQRLAIECGEDEFEITEIYTDRGNVVRIKLEKE